MRENLKEILQEIKNELEAGGVDLIETPALFDWIYPDDPMIKYQLLIREIEPEEARYISMEGANDIH